MLVEDPEGIKQIMKDCKTIAIVGFSDDPGQSPVISLPII